MANFNRFLSSLPRPLRPLARLYEIVARALHAIGPKRLYTRALLIILLPIIILQSVLVFVFMERHYDLVSRRMSEAVVREIASMVFILENLDLGSDFTLVERMGSEVLGLSATVLPPEPLPPPTPKPYFDVIDQGLSRAISTTIGKPFWIDTVGNARFVEIRIQLKDHVLRVFARRSQTFASNSHIFLVWMFTTSLVLVVIAMLFLRNQIRPVVRLAEAAESFGKGRPTDRLRPSGAREVRQASHAFIEMRRRIERQIEQRTTMLAGVSHDLRTILTRFRLQLALLPGGSETEGMKRDVNEMTHMLEDYLAFARGDGDEAVVETDMALMLEELEEEAEISGTDIRARYEGEPMIPLRRNAMKRCLSNLITNASKFGGRVEVHGILRQGWLTVTIDDDGPGIPASSRDDAFRPFHRLDEARNQDLSGSGLGLAIARDIARSHGGEIYLEDSPLGGLRARVRLPA